MKRLQTKKEDKGKGKRGNELARRRKKAEEEREIAILVHLADVEAVLTRAKMILHKPFARRVVAEAPIKWIRMTVGLSSHHLSSLKSLLVDPHLQILMMISVLNPCKKSAERKLTNGHTVVLYCEEKEVLWLLSCKTELKLVYPVVVKLG